MNAEKLKTLNYWRDQEQQQYGGFRISAIRKQACLLLETCPRSEELTLFGLRRLIAQTQRWFTEGGLDAECTQALMGQINAWSTEVARYREVLGV